MKKLLLSSAIAAIVANTAYAEHSVKTTGRGSTSAPAQYQTNFEELASGPQSYKSETSKFLHIRGSRFTTISNLLPLAELNVLMVAPTQDYMYYKTDDWNLLDSVRVSNGIDLNPGYPSPPTPTTAFTDKFEVKARLINAYADANNNWNHVLGGIITDENDRLIMVGMKNDFDDFDLNDGRTLKGSQGKRDTWGLSYGRKMGDHVLSYSLMKMEIDNAGVPAATLDVDYADVDANILSYEYNGETFQVDAEVRKINVDRNLDSYKNRPWLPSTTNEIWDNPIDTFGPPPNGAPPLPAPAFLIPQSHAYYGEINSLVDAQQGIDAWEYHLGFTTQLAGGTLNFGLDGTLNDVDVRPSKPANDDAFDGLIVNPLSEQGASVDWAQFQVNPSIEENTYSAYSEYDYAINAQTALHLGARVSLHQLDQTLDMNPNGVDGRLLYEVLGLRHLLENVYGVNYSETSLSGASDNANVTKEFIDVEEETVDLVGRLTHKLNDNVTVSGSLSYLEEQPSGFERVFQAGFDPASNTLDGQTYFGNHGLDKEKHKRIDLAISYDNLSNFYAQGRVWYDRIDDYIQGVSVVETTNDPLALEAFYELSCGSVQYAPELLNTPPGSTGTNVGWAPERDANGNPIGFDCQNANPLRFDNIDAEMYGMEFSWGYKITDNLLYSGVAAWQRGKRRDTAQIHLASEDVNSVIGLTPDGSGGFNPNLGLSDARVFGSGDIINVEDDNLYRIMPPYTHMALTYAQPMWQATLEGTFYMEQDHTSKTTGAIFNQKVANLTEADFAEDKTGGYGVINTVFSLTPHPALRLDMGVNNIFDKQYTNHLTGINRRWNNTVSNADVGGSTNDNWLDYGERIPGLGRNAFVKLTLGIKWPLPKGGM
jgi:iron complex outermembrane receptor protein